MVKEFKVITVTNRKGGTGKSTMSAHIAAGLATAGYNVGIVDTDSQGHAGLLLGMPDEDGLFNALIGKQPIMNVVRRVPSERYSTADLPSQGELWLLPSGEKTFKIPHELQEGDGFIFLEAMEQFAQDCFLDVIVVDTNPSMSKFDGSIYLATDGFIYPTECERLSFDGIQTAIAQIQRFSKQRQKYLNKDTRILGIIPNKMRPKTRLHRHNIEALVGQYPGLVWKPVMLATIWTEASNVEQLVFTYAPAGHEAKDAWEVVSRTKGALESWANVTAL